MSWVTFSWLVLLLIHATPSAAAFSKRLRVHMYHVDETPALGVVLAHRGVLFIAVALACLIATLDPPSRPLAVVVTGVSVLGFLALYARAGFPEGALRGIALVDLIGVPPLALVTADAWNLF